MPFPPRNLFAPDVIAPVVEKPKPKPLAKVVAPVREDPAKLLSGLSLKAVWIHGTRSLAMINGRLYGTGDALETGTNKAARSVKTSESKAASVTDTNLASGGTRADGDDSSSELLVVRQILPDKVLLTHRGVTLELTFTDQEDGRHSSGPPRSGASKAGAKTGK